MSFNTVSRRNDYTGDGTTTVFPYSFKIFDQTQLLVVRRTVPANSSSSVEIVLQLGTDYTVQGAGLNAGGSITLAIAPLTNDGLVIIGRQPLSQTTSIRNQDAYYPAVIEDALDMARMVDQQIIEEVRRSMRVAITTKGFSPVLGPFGATDGLKILRLNTAGTGFEVVDFTTLLASSGGGIATGVLKAPTDGTYGGSSGNPAKIAVGDLYEDAFDKVATLLGKMVPTPPNNLSALILTIPGSYNALAAGTGTAHLAIDSSSPTVTPGLAAIFANAFGDADAGTLAALIDAAQAGLVTLTTGDDTGLSNGILTVIAEFDPYAGQSGKSGLYKAITAKAVPTGLTTGQHTAQLVHSTTGATAVLTFFVDDPQAPTATVTGLTPSGATSYKSGVPGYATGAAIAVAFQVANAVRSHYSSGSIAAISSPVTTGTSVAPATPPAANSTFSGSGSVTVLANQYTENVIASVVGYNSKQVAGAPATGSAAIRVDTIGAETRVTSGTGQFPSSGYGAAYDSTLSLASNKALQYLAGAYRYPPAVSYAAALPAGPDYSALTPDTYANMRWVTFQFGTVNAATSVSFAFQNAANFGSSAIVSGLAIYVRVDGGTPTSGWVDGNAAYSGTGSPTANGDAGLDVSNSSATAKRITFGTAPKTGTVFVRIGIPQGSNKYFGGIA